MKKFNQLFIAVVVLIIASCNNNGTSNKSSVQPMPFISVATSSPWKVTVPAMWKLIAVKDGKIVFTGNKADAEKMKGDSTVMNDLQGKTLLPGFIDGHSHFINSLGLSTQVNCSAPPVGPGANVDAIIATMKDFVAKKSIAKGEIIVGWGYDDTKMPAGQTLNRDNLDAAFPDNPVVMIHTTMHGCVLNSMAMKKFNVTKGMKVPEGGVIQFKPGTKEPYGLLMETAYLPSSPQCPSQLGRS